MTVMAVKTKRSSTSTSENRLTKWTRQTIAQELLPNEGVAKCMCYIKGGFGVDVVYNPAFQSARYAGLLTCGSVWHCPVCAARIAERRREELEKGIEQHTLNGGTVWMATYTVGHNLGDRLPDLLRALEASMRRVRQGRAAQMLKKEFGVIGTVTVREVTYGENGWHPHMHMLIFLAEEIDSIHFERVMRTRWENATKREGLDVNEHGFSLEKTYGNVANYVTKLGRQVNEQESFPLWSAASEMTQSYAKVSRSDEGITPFAMLDLVAQGLTMFVPLFNEYATWYKGKRQLVWSNGLRAALLNKDEELSDKELAMEPAPEESEGLVLFHLSPQQWWIVVARKLRGELLELARYGERELIVVFLADIGIQEQE